MTTSTRAAKAKAEDPEVQNPFADLENEFADEKNDVWAREEQFTVVVIAEIDTVPMPANILDARQINYNSSDFKEAYPAGLPCLMIGLKGISVDYAFSEDHIRRIYIPLYGTDPTNYGKKKGRRSQAHIVSQAFMDVFKVRPFGASAKEALIGRKAIFGQHLGEAKIEGSQQEWAWDVPREALPDNYKYEGEVRVLQARDGGGSGGASVGAAQLDEDEANKLVVAALVGLDVKAKAQAADAIIDIVGLPSEWYDAATNGNVLQLANQKGLVKAEDGKVVTVDADPDDGEGGEDPEDGEDE